MEESSRYNLFAVEGGYYFNSLNFATLFLHPQCVKILIEAGCDARSVLSDKSVFFIMKNRKRKIYHQYI